MCLFVKVHTDRKLTRAIRFVNAPLAAIERCRYSASTNGLAKASRTYFGVCAIVHEYLASTSCPKIYFNPIIVNVL